MKVLFISPCASLDPPGGDVTYTQTLTVNPPTGVCYETYDEALRLGHLREHGRREALKRAWHTRESVLRELTLLGCCKLVDRLRRLHVLFWEPFRFFSVKPDVYDLIHVHVFSVGFLQRDCPLVVSCGGPIQWLYTDARRYSNRRVAVTKMLDDWLARRFKVNHSSGRCSDAGARIVYTKTAANAMAPVDKQEQFTIIPTSIEIAEPRPTRERPSCFGFIARNFEDKGGPLAMKAFELVRQARPDAEMTVIGCEPINRPDLKQQAGVSWLPYVARDKLLNELIPSFDVFVYPTRSDYLPCLTLLEVMARGLPVAATDYRGMADVLGNGQAGLVSPPDDAASLAKNMLDLLDPATNKQISAQSRARCRELYDIEHVKLKLCELYTQVTLETQDAVTAAIEPACQV